MPGTGKFLLVISMGLAISFALLWFYYTPTPKALVGDENFYYQSALQATSGQDLPYDLRWPPFYAVFISAVFRLFGAQRIIYVQIVQIGLWVISALLFERIVWKLSGSRTAAAAAFSLFVLSPELIVFAHYLWPETLHLFLWLASLWLLICRPRSRPAAALAGVLLGLAVLTKSLLTPFIPLVAFFVFLLDSSPVIKTRLVNAALLCAFTLAVVLPVMLDNRLTRGVFLVADSSIFNAWVGLNDVQTSDSVNEIVDRETVAYLQSGSDLISRNAVYAQKIRFKIDRQGPAGTLLGQIGKQYFRLLDVQTFFTTQLPGGGRQAYTTTSALSIVLLKLYSYVIYGFILVVGALGLCFLRLRPLRWHHLFALFIAFNLGLFLFLHDNTRYVIQFMPMLIFFASMAMDGLVHRKEPDRTPSGLTFSRLRLGIASFVGIAMIFVVFYNLVWKQFLAS